jgi:hypothetical protein
MGIAPAATVAYDHRDAEATRSVFAASAENAREYALGRRTRSVYCEQQKRASGDRFTDLLSQEPKSNKPSKRELKKGIVDDINL